MGLDGQDPHLTEAFIKEGSFPALLVCAIRSVDSRRSLPWSLRRRHGIFDFLVAIGRYRIPLGDLEFALTVRAVHSGKQWELSTSSALVILRVQSDRILGNLCNAIGSESMDPLNPGLFNLSAQLVSALQRLDSLTRICCK